MRNEKGKIGVEMGWGLTGHLNHHPDISAGCITVEQPAKGEVIGIDYTKWGLIYVTAKFQDQRLKPENLRSKFRKVLFGKSLGLGVSNSDITFHFPLMYSFRILFVQLGNMSHMMVRVRNWILNSTQPSGPLHLRGYLAGCDKGPPTPSSVYFKEQTGKGR